MFSPGAKMSNKLAPSWDRNKLPGEKLPQHKWLDVITTSNTISDAYTRDFWQGIMKWRECVNEIFLSSSSRNTAQ
jgi:hypothetical protein